VGGRCGGVTSWRGQREHLLVARHAGVSGAGDLLPGTFLQPAGAFNYMGLLPLPSPDPTVLGPSPGGRMTNIPSPHHHLPSTSVSVW